MQNLPSEIDNKLIAAFSAGGVLQAVGAFLVKYEGVFHSLFTITQVTVGVLSVVLLWKKIYKKK